MSTIGNKITSGLEKIGVVRQFKEPPVKTVTDPADTYDTFKGVNLGIIKAGKFQDADAKESVEKILDKTGAAQLKKAVEQTGQFKKVEVDPNADKKTKTAESESFKGVVFFNRWKMGTFRTQKKTEVSTQFNVHAKIPIAGGEADMNSKMSQVQPTTMESRTWFSMFQR